MKRALIVGCSGSIWQDVEAAFALTSFDTIYCIKLAGVHWPGKFDVWVTLHPEFMDDYEAQRHGKGLPNGYEIVAPPPAEVGEHGKKGRITRRVSFRWPGMTSSASSGIFGAKVALDDGHDKVVLAGIPMTRTTHFARGESPWRQLGAFLPGFEKSVPHLRGRVKSMSGMTEQVLGRPTAEWLASG